MRFKKYIKNKFIVTTGLFLIYILFLGNMDVFAIVKNLQKRNALASQNVVMEKQLMQTKNTVRKLYKPYFLESYARSHKFFKKNDEEIFVITTEAYERAGK